MIGNRHFLLPNKNHKFDAIPFADILYLQGRVNYTLIHLRCGKIKISPRTLLYHITHSLNDSFLRIHRAFCVNRIYIQSYDEKIGAFLLLENGIKLSVSRRKKHVLFGQ